MGPLDVSGFSPFANLAKTHKESSHLFSSCFGKIRRYCKDLGTIPQCAVLTVCLFWTLGYSYCSQGAKHHSRAAAW